MYAKQNPMICSTTGTCGTCGTSYEEHVVHEEHVVLLWEHRVHEEHVVQEEHRENNTPILFRTE